MQLFTVTFKPDRNQSATLQWQRYADSLEQAAESARCAVEKDYPDGELIAVTKEIEP